jgi:acyl phosphate:glycerol-3-phosphate acyltransferase
MIPVMKRFMEDSLEDYEGIAGVKWMSTKKMEKIVLSHPLGKPYNEEHPLYSAEAPLFFSIMPYPLLLLLVLAYVCGSLPFGLWVSRARGVDIRKVGSGNIGATNVLRCVGKPWGILVFVLDFLKGLLPPLAVSWVAPGQEPQSLIPWELGSGVLAIVGHTASLFLGFKGGKGVATSAGVLAGVAPMALLPALGLWILLFSTLRIVSLASIAAAAAVGVGAWFFYPRPVYLPALLSTLAVLVIWKHRSNLGRLLRGEEAGFRKKSGGERA